MTFRLTEHTINVPPRLFIGRQLYNLLSYMPHTKCDVLAEKTKNINKTLQRKSKKKTCIKF